MKIISLLAAALVASVVLAAPAEASQKRDICLSLSVLGLGPIVLSIGDPPDFSCLVQPDGMEQADDEADTPDQS